MTAALWRKAQNQPGRRTPRGTYLLSRVEPRSRRPHPAHRASPLAEVEPWDWAETDEGEPVVCIERHATFTGLDTGDIDLTTTVPNTSMIGVWRIDPANRYNLIGLADDPIATAAGEQAPNN